MPPGIRVVETSSSPASAVSMPSAVIALIGTAPIGAVNTLTQCNNATADSVFGLQVPGFTIPQALSAIRKNEPNAKVLIVNVAATTYGTAQTNVTVTNESITLVAGAGQLAYAPESSPAPVVKDTTLATTYIQGTDYTISSTGAFVRVGTAIGATDVIKVTYAHLPNHTLVANKATLADVPFRSLTPVVYSKTKSSTYVSGTDYTISAYGVLSRINGGAMAAGQEFIIRYETFDGIIASDIIGTAVPATGLYCFNTSESVYGYEPTLWLCPTYAALSGVVSAVVSQIAEKGGVFFLDAPQGLSVAQAITARGAGSGNLIDQTNERIVVCYPNVYVYSPADDANELRPLSPFLAGYAAMVDRLVGPQRWIGNFYNNNIPVAVKGIEDMELDLTFDPDNTRTTDCSQLADVEIVTLRPGFIPWGDRSTAYRDSTDVKTFAAVRRVVDIVKRSIIKSALQFIGQPMSAVLRDAVLQNGNAYLTKLTGDGWILSGSMIYNVDDNPDAELALGHWVFGFSVIPSIGASEITYYFNVTTEGIAEILGA